MEGLLSTGPTPSSFKRFKSVYCNYTSYFEKSLAQNLLMEQKSRCNARQYSLGLLQAWKIFYNYGCQATQISRLITPEPVSRGHKGPRRGASSIRLRRRERRAAVREAIDIGDTTDKAVNVNETIPEPVEENEPAESAEETEKSVYEISAAEIYIYTLA